MFFRRFNGLQKLVMDPFALSLSKGRAEQLLTKRKRVLCLAC